MNKLPIVGCGLACAIGLDLSECMATLEKVSRGDTPPMGQPMSRNLPGGMGGEFPYFGIPLADPDWHARVRTLVRRVAAEAGWKPGCSGVLFVATSSFDVGAPDASVGDYRLFIDTIARHLDWNGPVYGISTACTSSLNALLAAQAMLRSGMVEEALVLGIELDNLLTLGGFAALQLLSRTGSKPFGAGRDGLVLGESVAALRLATRGEATWSLVGGANVIDGSNPTGASEPALAEMYGRTLATSGWRADQVDLVKVQAAGSPGNDLAEARALHAAFGQLPDLVSLKHVIGHTMGASGAAEVALLTACLDRGVWPGPGAPVDPELGLRLAGTAPVAERVLATILGFGGSHATVALERI